MSKKSQKVVLQELQNNADVVILNNAFAVPRLTRISEKGKSVPINDDYSRKVFYKIVSLLNPSHLEMAENGKDVFLQINIKEFLEEIEATNSNNLYKYVIDCVDRLQMTQVKWEDTKYSYGVSVISYYKHDKGSGKIDLQIHHSLIKLITPVTEWEHFSFYLKHILRLQSKQAGNLFSYLVSWRNRGMVDIQLDAFKRKFGYDTGGYKFFNNLKLKVLDPALNEINEKTELFVKCDPIGENLTGKRPRVTGLRFLIQDKTKQKQLTTSTTSNGLFDQVSTTPPATAQVDIEEAESPLMAEFADQVAERYGIGAEAFGKAIKGKTKQDVLQAMEATEERRKKGGLKDPAGLFLKALKDGYKSAERVKKEVRETKQKQSAETVEAVRQLEEQREEARFRRREAVGLIIKGMTASDPTLAEEVKEKADGRNAMLRRYTVEDLRKPENKKWRGVFIEEFVKEYPEVFGSVVSEFDEQIKKIEVEIEKLRIVK